MAVRQQKLEELMRQLAAQFVQIESSNASLITVTRCMMEQKLKHAIIFVTVLPESEERHALEFLKRKRSEFRGYVKSHARTRVIPVVNFEIDIGEKTRQKIDELGIKH